MAFALSQEIRGPSWYITLEGAVDLSTTPELLRALKVAFKKAPEEVVLDLAAVDHMDSSGIAAMVEGVRQGQRTGKTFWLTRVPERVNGVLELANLVGFFRYKNWGTPD
jgi:anti-sigma B factor antagonist